MKKYWIDFAISTFITLLRDESAHDDYRKPILKVFVMIWKVFGNEPEFQAVLKNESIAQA